MKDVKCRHFGSFIRRFKYKNHLTEVLKTHLSSYAFSSCMDFEVILKVFNQNE